MVIVITDNTMMLHNSLTQVDCGYVQSIDVSDHFLMIRIMFTHIMNMYLWLSICEIMMTSIMHVMMWLSYVTDLDSALSMWILW